MDEILLPDVKSHKADDINSCNNVFLENTNFPSAPLKISSDFTSHFMGGDGFEIKDSFLVTQPWNFTGESEIFIFCSNFCR